VCRTHISVLDELDVYSIMKIYEAAVYETTIFVPGCENQKLQLQLQLLGMIHRWHGGALDVTEQLSCYSVSFCNVRRPWVCGVVMPGGQEIIKKQKTVCTKY
jgi:hypothetical protein